MANNINYKTLAKEILATLIDLDTETESFNNSIKNNYSTALNDSILTYKTHIEEKLNSTASNALNIRVIMVELFREIEDTTYEDALSIITEKLKVEFNKVKRKERYKRALAIDSGKEYVSELVNFTNVDKSKLDTSEELIESDKIDIYELLNNKKSEIFGKEIINEDDTKNIESSKPNFKINAKIDNVKEQKKDIIQSKPKKVEIEEVEIEDIKYEYPDEIKTILVQEFNLNQEYKKLPCYRILINGKTKYANLLPFIPNVISNITTTRMYNEKRSNQNIEIEQYNWQISLNIATNKNIDTIIQNLKGYKMLENVDFYPRVIYKFGNGQYVSII